MDHILIQCPYAREVWYLVLGHYRLNIAPPSVTCTPIQWWVEARNAIPRSERKGFDSLFMLTSWAVWKQRNAQVFGKVNQQLQLVQLMGQIIDEAKEWRAARAGGFNNLARE